LSLIHVNHVLWTETLTDMQYIAMWRQIETICLNIVLLLRLYASALVFVFTTTFCHAKELKHYLIVPWGMEVTSHETYTIVMLRSVRI